MVMSTVLSNRNSRARIKMMIWFKANYNPSIKNVSESVGVNYDTFRKFLKGTRELNVYHLTKIENFLSEQAGREKRIERNQKALEQYRKFKEEQDKELTLH